MNCFPNKCDIIFDALVVSSLVVRASCSRPCLQPIRDMRSSPFALVTEMKKSTAEPPFPQAAFKLGFFLLQEEVAAKAHGCCLQYAFPSYPYSSLPRSSFLHSSSFSELLEAPGSQFQDPLTKKLGFPVKKSAKVLRLCCSFCRKYLGMLHLVFFPLCILEEGL